MSNTSGMVKMLGEVELTEDNILGAAIPEPLGYITSTKVLTAYTLVGLDSIFLHIKYS